MSDNFYDVLGGIAGRQRGGDQEGVPQTGRRTPPGRQRRRRRRGAVQGDPEGQGGAHRRAEATAVRPVGSRPLHRGRQARRDRRAAPAAPVVPSAARGCQRRRRLRGHLQPILRRWRRPRRWRRQPTASGTGPPHRAHDRLRGGVRGRDQGGHTLTRPTQCDTCDGAGPPARRRRGDLFAV